MRKPTTIEVGPEYPGEGAIKTIHSRVYLCRMLWEYTTRPSSDSEAATTYKLKGQSLNM